MKKKLIGIMAMLFLIGWVACASEKNADAEDFETAMTAGAQQEKNYTGDDITRSRRNAITQSVEQVSPAVVGINVMQIVSGHPIFNDPFLDLLFSQQSYRKKIPSLGSGFMISADGYLLTNEHVVHNAAEIVVTLTGGKKYAAKIIGSDRTADIALLKIDSEDRFRTVRFGNSNDVITGEWAIAIGNPFGLFEVGAEPSVSVGVISAVNRDFGRQDDRVYQDMIQTDAAINGGNSGGPLVNSSGEVIGINSFIFSGSEKVGTSIGLGFAIPINRVRQLLPELKKFGKVNRQFSTGLKVENMSRLLANSMGLQSTDGVIVADVAENSPAQRAGLEVWDVIIQVNDSHVTSAEDIWRVIEATDAKGGDVLVLDVVRDEKVYQARLQLEKVPLQ
ncbi:trypsin-like peptidase domain-containing protein [bacterium]|nr:trypsin-like peptidase domain-containing protein [bacterium]